MEGAWLCLRWGRLAEWQRRSKNSKGAANGPDQIRGLELAYTIGPIVFVMLAGACFYGYKLSAERHADIRRQLDERDDLYAEAPVIETLTSEPGEVAPSRP